MAAQIVYFCNKHGFCKYLDKCRNYHENQNCEQRNCEIRECPLRHPKICKFHQDYGYCKFVEWCRFYHKIDRDASKKTTEIKKLQDKLKAVEAELEKNADKVVLRLESEIQDLHPLGGKMSRLDQIRKKTTSFNIGHNCRK